jgi:hypothetical protein
MVKTVLQTKTSSIAKITISPLVQSGATSHPLGAL